MKDKIKVLLINKTFSPYYSSTSTYVTELAKYLLLNKHEVHILTAKCCHRIPGLIIHEVPTSLNMKFPSHRILCSALHTIYLPLLRRQFKLDIIHTQGIGCVGGNVVTFHSGGYEERIKTGCHELKSQLLYFLEKNIMEIAEAIIVPSNLAKNSIMTFYKVSEKKLHVIPHGVDINKFHPINRQERTKIRARYGFREGDFLVYFSSTFKRRNLECLIKALPRIKNAKLIITGGGNFSYYARLSKDLGVSSRVMFLGYLPDIQEIYSIADVYVLPTLYDTFGLSILEAMASGVPVIVSKMAGSAELITNGKEGFILNKLTVDEIVDKLLLLIDNCELRSTMGNNARRTALKHTWQKVANDTLNVYRKVLS